MANFSILQEIKGEWRSTKTMEIMGLRIPAYFTDDPRLLYDYIVNFKTKSDDVFVVSYPKAGWNIESSQVNFIVKIRLAISKSLEGSYSSIAGFRGI